MNANDEAPVALEKIAQLSVGGNRLAVSADGRLVAIGTDEEIVLVRDLAVERTVAAPGAIDRLRFGDGGKTLFAAPYALDLATEAFTTLPPLDEAFVHGLDGVPSGQFLVRRADWTPDGAETDSLCRTPSVAGRLSRRLCRHAGAHPLDEAFARGGGGAVDRWRIRNQLRLGE